MAPNTANDKNDSSIPGLFEIKSQRYSRLPSFNAPAINEKTTRLRLFSCKISKSN